MQQYNSKRGKFCPGIYLITCLKNKKFYVGSSTYSLFKRIRDHQIALKNNKHPNKILQRTYNKYGKESFTFDCLEKCNQETVLEREQYWMDLLESYNVKYGFNIVPKAGNSKGYKFTKKHKENISKGIQKIGGNKGKFNPRYGAIISEEQKIKRKESLIKNRNLKPFYVINQDLSIFGVYFFASEVAKIIKCHPSLIRMCLKEKIKTGKGFAYCYLDRYETKIEKIKNDKNYFIKNPKGVPKLSSCTPVKRIDINSREEIIFNSIKNAAENSNMNANSIVRILSNKRNSKKYKFEYI